MWIGVHHKGAARSAMIVTAMVCGYLARAQEPDVQYHVVQAVVGGLRSPAQCAQIDLYLRAQADVIVARTDYNTRNVMLQIPHFSSFTREHLRDLFASLGLEIHCYRRYPLSSAMYTPLDPRNCVEELPTIDR